MRSKRPVKSSYFLFKMECLNLNSFLKDCLTERLVIAKELIAMRGFGIPQVRGRGFGIEITIFLLVLKGSGG